MPSMQGENITKEIKTMVLELDEGEKLLVVSWLTVGSEAYNELGTSIGG